MMEKKLNWFKTISLVIAITLSNIIIAQNQTADNPWKLIKTNTKGDGWQIYKRKVSGSKLQQFKIVGKLNVSMLKAQKVAMEMFTDPDLYYSQKGKPTGTFKILEQTESDLTLYSYMYGPSFMKDRDVVVRYSMYEDTTANAVGVRWHHLEKEGYEATDTVIRMPVDIGDWRFEEITPNSCMASCTLQFHPGGNPPSWMINMMVKWVLPSEIEHLREDVISTN